MTRKNPPMAWDLPLVIDPPTICFQINVPNERFHLAAFYGAIYLLTRWYAWKADDAHTGRLVGKVWMRVFDNLIGGSCTVQPKIGSAGADAEDNLIRQNPDNPCLLETSIDGVNWCAFADLSKCQPAPPQPGGGSQQPQPGGGCVSYHGTMGAKEPWYIPTVVSDGDTVEITSAVGSWTGGDFSRWYCADGERFFAGKCIGLQATDSGDPLPTAPHMSMILKVGSTYYDLSSGPVTISGGATNEQALIYPNDSDLTDNAGTITFDVKVCNNQAAAWTHVFEFATDPFGWAPYDTGGGNFFGDWVPGSGFEDTDASNSGLNARGVAIARSFASRTLTGVVMEYDYTTGSVDSGAFVIQNVADAATNFIIHHLADVVAGTDVIDPGVATSPAQTIIRLQYLTDITAGARSGSCRLIRLTLTGLGSDPF